MEDLDTSRACMAVDEGFLDFALEGEGEEEESDVALMAAEAALRRQSLAGSFPEMVEEELEWLSNKDAFPSVETCFGILADNPELVLNHQSPVSVLENSSTSSNTNSNGGCVASCCNSLKVPVNHPVRARSKRRRRRAGVGYLASPESWLNQVNAKNRHESSFALSPLPTVSSSGGGSMGRRCLHCQADKTPQWRAGPMGPKTLCNACGVRYKSGRLLPEYRPANSPTFSSVLHSNSHRKVVEMRRQKQGEDGVNVGCGYSVG